MVRAMCWNSRALHLVRRLRWFAVALLCTLLVSSVYAATGSVRVTPISSVATTPSTVRTTFEVATVSLDAVVRQTEYQARSSALSSRTVGSLARKGLRGGVYGVALGLAIEGIIDGAGWAINELKDQVMSGPPAPTEVPPGGEYYVGSDGKYYSTAQAAAIGSTAARNNNPYGNVFVFKFMKDCQGGICKFVMEMTTPGGQKVDVEDGVSQRFNSSPRPMPVFDTQPLPVSDEQLGDAVKGSPEVVNDLLTDPRTGYPMPTPELQKQIDDLKKEIEDREGIPNSDPSPAPDMEDDTAKDSETSWPSFCGWASAVCEFFKWVKTDDTDTEKPETPWEEEDPAQVTQSWSSGLGGGSCPSPVSFTVSLGGQSATPEFSFSPICQFGTMMRPVIIALATIISGFIIAGVRGTKDA